MGNTKDSQSMNVEHPENIKHILGNTVNKNQDFQITTHSKEEITNTEIAQIIQMLADKLIEKKYSEWHKIVLKDGRKGFALFFENNKWELVDNQIVEIKV